MLAFFTHGNFQNILTYLFELFIDILPLNTYLYLYTY